MAPVAPPAYCDGTGSDRGRRRASPGQLPPSAGGRGTRRRPNPLISFEEEGSGGSPAWAYGEETNGIDRTTTTRAAAPGDIIARSQRFGAKLGGEKRRKGRKGEKEKKKKKKKGKERKERKKTGGSPRDRACPADCYLFNVPCRRRFSPRGGRMG